MALVGLFVFCSIKVSILLMSLARDVWKTILTQILTQRAAVIVTATQFAHKMN